MVHSAGIEPATLGFEDRYSSSWATSAFYVTNRGIIGKRRIVQNFLNFYERSYTHLHNKDYEKNHSSDSPRLIERLYALKNTCSGWKYTIYSHNKQWGSTAADNSRNTKRTGEKTYSNTTSQENWSKKHKNRSENWWNDRGTRQHHRRYDIRALIRFYDSWF